MKCHFVPKREREREREREVYEGHENILHFLLTMKKNAEEVAESIDSVMDFHCQKRRGHTIEEMGNESIIHWSGPPVHLAIFVKSP